MSEHNVIQQAIVDEVAEIRDMLLAKNQAYGSSVFEPIGIFSNLPPEEGIRIRLDDKLKRMKNTGVGSDASEDTEFDLVGYIILLRVLRRLKEGQA